MNDETAMTKVQRRHRAMAYQSTPFRGTTTMLWQQRANVAPRRVSSLVIVVSFVIRISSFVIPWPHRP
jgi:hypothetical protein